MQLQAEPTYDEGLINALIDYIDYPEYFAEDILHAKLERWQREMLRALGERDRVAVRSGHGVGKTAGEAMTILWFLSTRPYPKIPCTAPTQRQLFDILWAEVAKWIDRTPEMKQIFDWHKSRIQHRDYPERWFATPRTSNKPENLAGFHEEHILFVVDEASGVADQIYEVIEGALTTDDAKLLICGNPTKTSGVFYNAFHKNRGVYYPIKVGVRDVSPERVKPGYRENLVRQYGEDSDVVRVRADGEFPKSEPDQLIPLEIAEAAAMRELYMIEKTRKVQVGNELLDEIYQELHIPQDEELHLGVDVARFGDDETSISARIGKKEIHKEHHRKEDTMETTGRVLAAALMLMREYDRPGCKIKIDDDGVGGGVVDRLNEMARLGELHPGIEIIPCHNGRTARDEEHYDNWSAEAWDYMKKLLKYEGIELINDEDTIAQLTTRKYKITSRGRIALERKEDMKKRGLRSPDRADAVILAFVDETPIEVQVVEPTEVEYQDLMEVSLFDELYGGGYE